ncbi:MAG TPA: hypothetical protein VK929_01780 [Longimicrobiales bacterium]|nr:hypothetical protein [Longimicrobiales bacterium]
MARASRFYVAVLMLLIVSAPADARQANPDRLRVFADCGWCDMDFLRTEITWVDHVRDRADAQVHVLVSRETTGGGGGLFTLEFIGLRQFAGRTDTLTWLSGANDSPDTRRRGLTQVIGLGLVPFAARTGVADRLGVSYAPAAAQTDPGAAGAAGTAEQPHDPWNFWTFRVGMNGNSSGESQQGFDYLSGNITANRTTADWKINLSTNGSYNESRFEYTVGDELIRTKSIRRNYGGNALVVRSLTPHLSAGLRAGVSTSTFGNTRLSVSFSPAVEYNLVPYSESTRRSFTIQYSAGVRHADYREITLFDQEEETRPVHSLDVTYTTRQPWGNVNIGVNGAQYLHDTGKYNTGIGGSTDLRLFRGFSFNIGGNYSRVRDQLHLPRRDLTEQEILLRQRALATSYNYFVYGGISYRFGSIFSNVVNPRMGSSSQGGMVIMM